MQNATQIIDHALNLITFFQADMNPEKCIQKCKDLVLLESFLGYLYQHIMFSLCEFPAQPET